jgi:hypothetical protein
MTRTTTDHNDNEESVVSTGNEVEEIFFLCIFLFICKNVLCRNLLIL